jgi:tripartite-type tricarboxylate transporter receptor subunit TctC
MPIRSMRLLLVALVLELLVPLVGSEPGWAAWPERTVRVVVPSPPGGAIDLAARLYSERLASDWKVPVVVDNRPGADGILAAQTMVNARDDHTLLFSFPGIVTVVPLLHDSLPYDPVTDLMPISAAASDTLAIVAGPSMPATNLDGLLSLARARPIALNWYAAPGAPYLTFLDFQRKAGVEMTFVPYRGPTSALPDLMAGQIQVLVVPLGPVLPLFRDKRLKPLAVTTQQRSPSLPEVLTAAEQGHLELTVEARLGFFGSKAFDASLRDRIAADVRRVAEDGAMKDRLRALGLEACSDTPLGYATHLRDQAAHWATLSRTYGIRSPQR